MAIRAVSVDEAIELLNGILAIDGGALSQLIAYRVECPYALAQHPTVQAGVREPNAAAIMGDVAAQADQVYEVGLLGIINGLFGVFDDGPLAGWGPIAAVRETDGSISSFTRTDARLIELEGVRLGPAE